MQLSNSIKKGSIMFVGTKFDWLIISNPEFYLLQARRIISYSTHRRMWHKQGMRASVYNLISCPVPVLQIIMNLLDFKIHAVI